MDVSAPVRPNKSKIPKTAEYLEWEITREIFNSLKNSSMTTYDLKINEVYLKILYGMSSCCQN